MHIISKMSFGALALSVAGALAAKPVPIPATFDADRLYVHLTTAGGEPLVVYSDSGGGAVIFSPETAARLRLNVSHPADKEILAELGPNAKLATSPELRAGLPPLPPLAVIAPLPPAIAHADGFVGAPWLAGGIWTWDYPGKRFSREFDGVRLISGPHVIPLTFKTEANGKRSTNFARMIVTIAGQRLPVLLDTGATTQVEPAALAQIADQGPATRATSFMSASVVDSWHSAHPQWRYIADAEKGSHAAMIEVPEVGIAGYSVGPVWFTRRPDTNFHQWMSSMMDLPIEGAVGGNVFRHFIMTVDYPSARARFVCRLSCKAVR